MKRLISLMTLHTVLSFSLFAITTVSYVAHAPFQWQAGNTTGISAFGNNLACKIGTMEIVFDNSKSVYNPVITGIGGYDLTVKYEDAWGKINTQSRNNLYAVARCPGLQTSEKYLYSNNSKMHRFSIFNNSNFDFKGKTITIDFYVMINNAANNIKKNSQITITTNLTTGVIGVFDKPGINERDPSMQHELLNMTTGGINDHEFPLFGNGFSSGGTIDSSYGDIADKKPIAELYIDNSSVTFNLDDVTSRLQVVKLWAILKDINPSHKIWVKFTDTNQKDQTFQLKHDTQNVFIPYGLEYYLSNAYQNIVAGNKYYLWGTSKLSNGKQAEVSLYISSISQEATLKAIPGQYKDTIVIEIGIE